MSFLRPLRVVVVLAALAALSGCSPAVDLLKVLAVDNVTTGWYDAGIVKGPEGDKNKLVPSISFTLTNRAAAAIASVQINAVFKRVKEEDELGSAWVKGIGPDGLPAGVATSPLVLRCPIGYTGVQPRTELLQHKDFIDARVFLFAKHGSAPWVKLGEYRIQRQLLTR
jgi:hypothetical protein